MKELKLDVKQLIRRLNVLEKGLSTESLAGNYKSLFKGKGLRTMIQLAILGDPKTGYPGIREVLDRFAGWMNDASFVMHYEELASADHRSSALRSLYDFLDVRLNGNMLSEIDENLVSSASPTFRKGSIGEWMQVFDDEINALFKQAIDDSLMKWYGYGHGR